MDAAEVRKGLVARVRAAQQAHNDLVDRERICRVNKYIASADALQVQVDEAFDELTRAGWALDAHDRDQQRSNT